MLISSITDKKKFGGGSLLDKGIYPISLISSIFGENLKLIDSNLHYNSDFEVDLGGIAKFKNNNIQTLLRNGALVWSMKLLRD